jgi:hypothetical protein
MAQPQKTIKDMMDEENRYKLARLVDYMQAGVVTEINPAVVIDLLQLYGQGVVWEDVTDSLDLKPNIKGGSQDMPIILTKEPLFKQGRVYAPRIQPMGYVVETRLLSHNLNVVADGALVIETANNLCRYKSINEIAMVFWADAARTTKETVTPRTIVVDEVINQVAVTSNSPTNIPNNIPVPITSVIQYQCNGTYNTADTTAGDILVKRGIILPKFHEVRVTINALAVDCYVDIWMLMDVKG